MPTATPKTAFQRGVRDGFPFVLAVAPFGLLFSVIASESGLDFWQTVSMSVLVIAGAAQFTALAQMQEHAPVIIVILAALAVNMRLFMYSASIAPHLGPAPFGQRVVAAYILVDSTYAQGMVKFDENPDWPVGVKMAYYFGTAALPWIVWYMATFAGVWFGRALPDGLALDFAPAIIFIAIIAPMLRTRAHVAAAASSVLVALALDFLPYSLGLLLAALVAMVVGAMVETHVERSA